MLVSSRVPAERYAIVLVVISAHLLALTLLSKARSSRPDTSNPMAHPPESLQWLELTAEPSSMAPESSPSRGALAERNALEKQLRVRHKTTDAAATVASPERAPQSAVESSAREAPIDWHREAQQAARSIVAEMAHREKRRCNDSRERDPSPLLSSCETPKDRFPWDPAPGRVGLAGGILPYVRLGKRCVLGLGFFGCALGKLPDANGHAFDHMDDISRVR
jgi:hypothetical protein